MGDLLPKDFAPKDFTSPEYWKKFFAQQSTPFEWYGDYCSLGDSIERYLKVGDQILQLGCGNSNFAAELHDNGFQHIHSVDIDEKVVADQKRRNASRAELTFAVENVTALSSPSGSKTLVLDKGTLDALLPPEYSEDQLKDVHRMFEEVDRVIGSNGRYIIISLAQQHLVAVWVDYFQARLRYILEVLEIPTKAKGFCMPVFILTAFKMAKQMPVPMPINFLRKPTAKPERQSKKELFETITAEQELSRFVAMCSQKLSADSAIRMGDVAGLGPRYVFTIVDSESARDINKFACFLVPLGKEGEWLFANPKGRQCLLKQSSNDRLMLVFLNRKHQYTGQEQIKDEINDFVARFDPRQMKGEISILSLGTIDARVPVSSGISEVNGRWTVEEIDKEEYYVRQLVFDSSSNLIQSEVFLKNVREKLVLDNDLLACIHHYMMLATLGLHASQPFRSLANSELKIALLGLGGGLLATFILHHLPRVSVTAVELDSEMVTVASKHFGLPQTNPRLSVKVMDALEYLKQTAEGPKSVKVDVLLVDVAAAMDENGLSCPPASFLEPSALKNMKLSLRNNGILALNLVTRNVEIAEKYREEIKKVFPKLYRLEAEEDINELLIGVNTQSQQTPDLRAEAAQFQSKASKTEWKEHVAGWLERIRPA